jgi:hypothetical protein
VSIGGGAYGTSRRIVPSYLFMTKSCPFPFVVAEAPDRDLNVMATSLERRLHPACSVHRRQGLVT